MHDTEREHSLFWWVVVITGTLVASTAAGVGLVVFFNGLPTGSGSLTTAPAERPPPVVAAPAPASDASIKDTVSLLEVLAKDLDARPESQGRFRRFLSFAHLTRFKTVSEEERQAYRAALRDVAALYKPAAEDKVFTPLDPGQSVYGFDLGDIGWDDDGQWAQVVKAYPYKLHHRRAANLRLRDLEQQVEKEANSSMPWVRGDWFLAAIGRPPLGGPGGLIRLPRTLPESVTKLAERYRNRELDAEGLAADLGLSEVKLFEQRLANEPMLRQLVGFETAETKTVRREQWETPRGATSPFQDTARELGLGTPVRTP
jgi:hypothetical protein